MPIKRRKISELKEAGDLTGFFTIGYRLVNGVKESVKYGLAYIYATYQDMLQGIRDLRSLEATVEENEESRETAESRRVASEQGRSNEEGKRVTQENARKTEEAKRIDAEKNRGDAEDMRYNAELARVSAENTRVTQENTRKASETARGTSETGRVTAETGRVNGEKARVIAEGIRVTACATLKQDAETATANANDTASHPTYIGSDHYVYKWNKTTKAYDKTDIYCKGDAFSVKRVYVSVAALQADVNNTDIRVGDFVLVNTGNVENPDNAKLYVKSKNASGAYSYDFLVDMSGAIGFTGKTPQFSIGTVSKGASVAVTLSEDGMDASGNPKYKLNIVLPQGDKGEAPFLEAGTVTTGAPGSQAAASLVANGSTSTGAPRYKLNLTIPQGPQGTGNMQVAVSGLVAGKTYLFKPSADNSANGALVEFAQVQSDWNATDTGSPSFIKNKPSSLTPSAHKHTRSDISDFPTSMPASDVYDWAKQQNRPSYSAADVGAVSKGGDTMTGDIKVHGNVYSRGGNHVIGIVGTTGGWERGLMWDSVGFSTTHGSISMFGTESTPGYISIGFGAYNDPKRMRIEPAGNVFLYSLYADEWIRNTKAGYGLYNQSEDARWYADKGYWVADKPIITTAAKIGQISLYGNNEINCDTTLHLGYRGGSDITTNYGGGALIPRGGIYINNQSANSVAHIRMVNASSGQQWGIKSGYYMNNETDLTITNDTARNTPSFRIDGASNAFCYGYIYSICNERSVQIGSQNASYCHFITTAPSYYFNTHLVIDGNVQPYVHGSFDCGSKGNAWAEVWAKNWFRTLGDTGWYNESYGGGIHMDENRWVKAYNAAFQCPDANPHGCNSFLVNLVIGNENRENSGLEFACSDNIFGIGLHSDDNVYFWKGISANRYSSVGKTYSGKINLVDNTFSWFGSILASGFFKESDIRLKSGIKPLSHTLDQILSIPTSSFAKDGKQQIGSIAQEIEKVCPEIVSESLKLRSEVPDNEDWEVKIKEKDGEPVEYVKVKSVEYEMLGVLGIEGLKLLYEEFKALKDLVKKQEDRIVVLEKTVSNDEK